ncbi:MAG: aspartate/glutamate racemase family protein [Chitinophagaceae bacterium]|nr:aspartate/glutamate racemase family protein [Chitinophagaceae bacterium]HQV61617.1 aspartate/glutamate racemase family protein [Chitinophagaceae bacterium]HQV84283.1 aspartate/glutamate racemase family protein [Chitinophagaceae bacterium]HQX71625.1 aspartate/glutamate racemase family protein [Chitinophagaceae bacterium]
MKVIGLVGGTSWISSVDYYRLFNEITNQRLGGNEAAKIVLYSVNYGEIVTYTHQGNWDAIAAIIADAAQKVEKAGADCILLGANTMHHVAERVQQSVKIPLLHIADVVGKAITEKQLKKVALLGTKYTMLFDFYTRKLAEYGIETIIPDAEGVDFVNSAIYNELGKGKFLPETKQGFLHLIGKLAGQGAEGVILGCTEIPMLIKQEDTLVPVFDTTLLHATAAVDFALQ